MRSTVQVAGVGSVLIYKRRSSKNIRLKVNAEGQVVISLPRWTPISTGVSFLKQNLDWVEANKPMVSTIYDGKHVGEAFDIKIRRHKNWKITSRLLGSRLELTLPTELSPNDRKIIRHIKDALRLQTERRVFVRTEQLASEHGFSYSSLKSRVLKSRWGSCSSDKQITFSCYLVQLPQDLVDYVILHELAHTEHLHHGELFWMRVDEILPGAKQKKKQLRKYQPTIL